MWCDVVGWGGISDDRCVSVCLRLQAYIRAILVGPLWSRTLLASTDTSSGKFWKYKIYIQISSWFFSDSGPVVKHPSPVHIDLVRCHCGLPRFLGSIEQEILVKIVSLSPEVYQGFELRSLQVIDSNSKSFEKIHYISPKMINSSVCVAKW